MATAIINNIVENSTLTLTLASYKSAGASFKAALIACGMVQTADTGQVDFTTVAAVPAAAGTDYLIFKFNDALQASAPFFVKFLTWGGTGGGNANKGFVFDMIVCTSTNGAGSPLNNISGQFSMYQGNSNLPTAGTIACYCSGDGSRLSMNWNPANTSPVGSISTPTGGFSLERLKDTSGNDTAQGMAVTWESRINGRLAQIVFSEAYGSIYPTSAGQWTTAMPNSGSASFGGNIGLFPVFPNIGYPTNPNTGALAAFGVDIPTPGSTFTISMYGTTRTYMAGTSVGLSTTGLNGNATVAIGCWRYD